MNNTLLLLLLSSLLFVSCTKDKASNPEAFQNNEPCANVSFANEVQPILNNSCAFAGCHSTASAASGIRLSTHAEVVATNENSLIGSIKHDAGFSPMPKNTAKLSRDNIELIKCWVLNGKPNN